MNNQRIETRSLFRFENFCDGNRIERISCEPIHGFCWETHHFALAQQLNGTLCSGGLVPPAAIMDRRYSLGLHFDSFAERTASDCFLRNSSNFFSTASSEVARMAAA